MQPARVFTSLLTIYTKSEETKRAAAEEARRWLSPVFSLSRRYFRCPAFEFNRRGGGGGREEATFQLKGGRGRGAARDCNLCLLSPGREFTIIRLYRAVAGWRLVLRGCIVSRRKCRLREIES